MPAAHRVPYSYSLSALNCCVTGLYLWQRTAYSIKWDGVLLDNIPMPVLYLGVASRTRQFSVAKSISCCLNLDKAMTAHAAQCRRQLARLSARGCDIRHRISNSTLWTSQLTYLLDSPIDHSVCVLHMYSCNCRGNLWAVQFFNTAMSMPRLKDHAAAAAAAEAKVILLEATNYRAIWCTFRTTTTLEGPHESW